MKCCSVSCVLQWVNHFKKSHVFIETGQDGPCFRFDYCLVCLRSGEPANRFHRVPKSEHNEFDVALGFATKQVGSAMSFNGVDFWKYYFRRMLNVVVGSI